MVFPNRQGHIVAITERLGIYGGLLLFLLLIEQMGEFRFNRRFVDWNSTPCTEMLPYVIPALRLLHLQVSRRIPVHQTSIQKKKLARFI